MDSATDHLPATEPSEIEGLRRGIHDLAGLVTLGAELARGEPSKIVPTLLGVLFQLASLDFAYASVGGSPDSPQREEWVRFARASEGAIPPAALGEALRPFLAGDSSTEVDRIANPLGEGTVSIAVFRLGLSDGAGHLACGSRRSDFPTDFERILLRVAANQAVIALQEARHIDRLR